MFERVGTYTSGTISHDKKGNKGFNFIRFLIFAIIGLAGILLFENPFLYNLSLFIMIISVLLAIMVLLT